MKQLGVGLATAILLDATLVRAVLLSQRRLQNAANRGRWFDVESL
jgi:hypothetical protein